MSFTNEASISNLHHFPKVAYLPFASHYLRLDYQRKLNKCLASGLEDILAMLVLATAFEQSDCRDTINKGLAMSATTTQS